MHQTHMTFHSDVASITGSHRSSEQLRHVAGRWWYCERQPSEDYVVAWKAIYTGEGGTRGHLVHLMSGCPKLSSAKYLEKIHGPADLVERTLDARQGRGTYILLE